MSSIYISEPPTKGKVLMVTTLGEFDIELWSKEAPLACRNFVQLCMEGYYDDTIFHRVVRNFCAQGGDPTATGEGGESIYGKTFKDEFHQRLRFTRRGLVAMANGGPNDNGSQFFFTLDRADELNNKHTIFGKVTGNTQYNLLKFNDLPTNKSERPFDPPSVIKTEILSNPFDDIVPRVTKTGHLPLEQAKPKSQSQATKDFGLLSFGDEAEEDEEETVTVSKDLRIVSSHDVLTEDPQLSSQPALHMEGSTKEESGSGGADGEGAGQEEEGEGYDVAYNDKMAEEVRRKLKRRRGDEEGEGQPGAKEAKVTSRLDDLRREAKQLRKELRSKDKEKDSETEDSKGKAGEVSDALREYQEEKAKYLTRGEMKKKGMLKQEDETVDMLSAFKAKLRAAREENSDRADSAADMEDLSDSGAKEGEGEDEESAWLSHRLVFEEKTVVTKDANVKNVDSYDIHDPRNPMTQRRREKSKDSKHRRRH